MSVCDPRLPLWRTTSPYRHVTIISLSVPACLCKTVTVILSVMIKTTTIITVIILNYYKATTAVFLSCKIPDSSTQVVAWVRTKCSRRVAVPVHREDFYDVVYIYAKGSWEESASVSLRCVTHRLSSTVARCLLTFMLLYCAHISVAAAAAASIEGKRQDKPAWPLVDLNHFKSSIAHARNLSGTYPTLISVDIIIVCTLLALVLVVHSSWSVHLQRQRWPADYIIINLCKTGPM